MKDILMLPTLRTSRVVTVLIAGCLAACLVTRTLADPSATANAQRAATTLPSITLATPTGYAVFQRSAANTARLQVTGHLAVPAAAIQARARLMAPYQEGVDGKSGEFVTIAGPCRDDFTGVIDVPAGGWYALDVRAMDTAGQTVAQQTIEKVGVGEVFVAAGHSFCSGYNAEAPLKATDDRVATTDDWSTSAGVPLAFRHCEDPLLPGDGGRASPWPKVGDALVGALHVPVLFVSTGKGGLTVEQWRKGAADTTQPSRGYTQFREALQRLAQQTGLRAVIWFGNENDLSRSPTAEGFSEDLERIIVQSRIDAGCPTLPWLIAFDAYDPAVAAKMGLELKQRSKENIDRGTELVLQRVPNTFDGPQTDDLGPEFRRSDHDHFNDAGLDQLALRFKRKITQAFFPPPVPLPQSVEPKPR